MAQTLELEAVRERLRVDTPFWAGGVHEGRPPGPHAQFQGCAKILDKRKRVVPLIAHPWQLEFDAALERQRAAGLPMRAIVLKARKLGFSTWVAAKFLQRLTQIPHQAAIVVAQDVKTAGVIFDMAKFIHAHLPTEEELGLGFSIRPDIIAASFSPNGRKFMTFGERSRVLREQGRAWESVFEIDTAGAPEAGRGYTPSLLHLSEVARWQTTAKMLSVLNAVPYVEESIIVLESTADGMNHFHKRWIAARDGVDDPDTGETYVPIFAPWTRDPECAMAFATEADRDRFVASIGTGPYGEDEPGLVELHGCTPEQLRWRRMMIRTQHEDSVEYFKQENPATDEEAFIGSGHPVFSGILVSRAMKAALEAHEPVRGTLRAAGWRERRTRGGTINVPTGAIWVPEAAAARGEPLLDVWEHPVTTEAQAELPQSERKPEGQYVIAVDVAEGAANTFTDGDFHAIHVLDHVTKMQVAEHRSKIDLHELPLWVVLVATYYNVGWLAVEVNGPGIAVIEPVQKDYRYRRCFRRRRAESARDVEEEKVGWKTDRVTKPLLEATYGEAMRDGTHGLRSVPTARELTTYVIFDNGKHGAQDGEHDDGLMAAMIAQRVADLVRPRKPRSRSVRGHTVEDDVTGY